MDSHLVKIAGVAGRKKGFVRAVTALQDLGEQPCGYPNSTEQATTMRNVLAAIGLVILATLALPAEAGGKSAVYGSASAVGMLAPYLGLIDAKSEVSVSVSPLGSGQLVLDVLDGKSVAAVVAMPLPQAIAAAREAAREQGRTLV
ncbi:MAG TPA: hypothetical protein VF287_02680, partial [Usitatibacter sp.]